MLTALLALAGVALAAALAAAVRRLAPRSEVRYWAAALVVVALVYLSFALTAGGAGAWREVLGVAVFGAIAAAGARGQPRLIALGWAAHAAWDVGFHLLAPAGYAPAGYAAVCLGFDLAVAAYLAWAVGRASAAAAAPAA